MDDPRAFVADCLWRALRRQESVLEDRSIVMGSVSEAAIDGTFDLTQVAEALLKELVASGQEMPVWLAAATFKNITVE